MYSRLQKITYDLLDPAVEDTFWNKAVDSFIIALIVLNVIAVVLETIHSLLIAYRPYFHAFDIFSVVVFSVEYILRVWTCTLIDRYKDPIKGRLKYIASPGAIIDLLAIAPFIFYVSPSFDFRFARIFRLVRLLRIFKLGRYLNATGIISNVLKAKREELILCLLMTIFLIITASSIMYFVEHEAQPEQFSSIPVTMWWSVTTLTTVGYGDVVPVTALGRILTAFISILGIGMFALPAGILASGFSAEFQKIRKIKHHCPHCGKEIP